MSDSAHDVKPPIGRGRRITVWVLVVLASLLAFLMVMTLWVDRQMLDNDSWRSASEDLVTDPEVRSALSVYLVNQLYERVDVAAALEQKLPEDAKGLAAPIAGALRDPFTRTVERLLSRPRLQQLFINASGFAHEKLLKVLDDETGLGITTGEGVVTLDLRELLHELGLDLGLSEEALAKLPEDAGVITVMKSDQLDAAQTGVKVIRALSIWFFVLVLGLYALAIYLARGRRRETLRNIGWAFVIVGVLSLFIRRFVGNYAVDALGSLEYRDSVRSVWLIGSSILGQIGRAEVVYGLVAVLGAVLAGPTRAATWVRRRIAPVLNESPGITWGGFAAVMLLLVLWGPTHALRTWWGILLFGVLLAFGLYALRRETLKEFPPAVGAVTPPPAAPSTPA